MYIKKGKENDSFFLEKRKREKITSIGIHDCEKRVKSKFQVK